MTRERKKSTIAALIILSILILMGWVEKGMPYAGQKCNFGGDCDLNETCVSVPYHSRDGSSYTGICMPRR